MPNVWPAGLPDFGLAENNLEQPENTQIRSTMQEGPAKLRKDPRPQPAQRRFEQRLTTTETQTLDTFWETTLSGGTDTFDETDPRTGVSKTWAFIGRPTYRHLGGNTWQASYQLEIRS